MTIDLSGQPIVIEVEVSTPTIEVDVSTPTIEVDIVGGGGAQGPPGPPGAGVGKYEVSFAAPSTTWTVNHGLGSSNVEVNAYDLSGVQEFDPEVEVTNPNTVTIRWYYPTTGIARVIG
jgi:hypothetical protein